MIKGRGNRTPGGLLGNGLFSLEREMLRGVFVEVLESQQVKGKVLELEELSYGLGAGLRALGRAGGNGLPGVGWELPERQGAAGRSWAPCVGLEHEVCPGKLNLGTCRPAGAPALRPAGKAQPRREKSQLLSAEAQQPSDPQPVDLLLVLHPHHREPKSPNIR